MYELHGHCTGGHSRTYISWYAMRRRCYNKSGKQYNDYGGRGITVCARWRNSFRAFLEDMGEKPDGATLERVNNSKGYTANNCKWASRTDQCRNKRNNHTITYKRVTGSISWWADKIGLKYTTLRARIRYGMTPKMALNRNLYKRKRESTTWKK